MTYKILIKFDSPPSFTFPPLFEDLIGFAWLVDNLGYVPKGRVSFPEPRIDFNRIAREGHQNFVIALNMDGIEILLRKDQLGSFQYRRVVVEDLTPFPIAISKQGYFLSSQMFYHKGGQSYIEPTRQKFDSQHSHLIDSKGKRKRYRTNAGPDKSIDIPQERHLISQAWFLWEAPEGMDATAIILYFNNYISSIGKKGRSQGRGEIGSFELEVSESVDFFSHLLRPIPIHVLDLEFNYILERNDYEVQERGWKAPGWLPENIAPCFVPNIELQKNSISYEPV